MPPKRKTKVGAGVGAGALQLRVPGTPQRVTTPASESKLESTATASDACPICALPIEDASETNEGQAALFCEGDCQCWYHSWCAGVSRQRYQSLAESTEPFLCPACTSQQQQRTIQELQGNVQALASEMLELKTMVAALQKASSTASNTETNITAAGGNELPWNTVVSRGNRGKKRNQTVCSGGGGAQHISKVPSSQHHSVQPTKEATSKASQGREPNGPSHANPRRKFVPIEDARRVWGTLRSTTTSAITNVIKRLTPGTLAENLTVKRKYKTNQEGVSKKWWFVIRGDKHNLEILEKEWSKVATQTGWKLEPAYCYDNSGIVLAQQSNASTVAPVDVVITNSTSTDCQTQPQPPTTSLTDPPLSSVPPQLMEGANV